MASAKISTALILKLLDLSCMIPPSGGCPKFARGNPTSKNVAARTCRLLLFLAPPPQTRKPGQWDEHHQLNQPSAKFTKHVNFFCSAPPKTRCSTQVPRLSDVQILFGVVFTKKVIPRNGSPRFLLGVKFMSARCWPMACQVGGQGWCTSSTPWNLPRVGSHQQTRWWWDQPDLSAADVWSWRSGWLEVKVDELRFLIHQFLEASVSEP